MFKSSEKANRKAYQEIQRLRIERRNELIRRLNEKAISDPDGIWNELLMEARQNAN
jgi:hypothetical protein